MHHEKSYFPPALAGLLLLTIAAISLFALAMLDSTHAPVQAKSNYLTAFRNTYPAVAGSQLDSCATCHTSVPNRNPYGEAYRHFALAVCIGIEKKAPRVQMAYGALGAKKRVSNTFRAQENPLKRVFCSMRDHPHRQQQRISLILINCRS